MLAALQRGAAMNIATVKKFLKKAAIVFVDASDDLLRLVRRLQLRDIVAGAVSGL